MRPRGALAWAKVGFLALALTFGAAFVVNRWGELTTALGDASLPAVVAAFVLGVVGVASTMPAWRAMVGGLGTPLPVGPAGRVFFLAQLGKYLPGSVWALVAQAELARELRVPRRVSVAATVLTMALSVVVGLVIATVLLPFGAAGTVRTYWWVLVIAPGLLVMLHPRVLETMVGRVLPADDGGGRRYPERRVLATAAGWSVVSWLALGAHAWLLVVAMGGPAGRSFPVAVGGFALAYCLGLLFLPVPAGAGVRDVSFGLAVAGVLGEPAVVAVVLASRVMLTVGDAVLAGGWAVAVRRSSGGGVDRSSGQGDDTGAVAAGESLEELERHGSDPHGEADGPSRL